MTDGTPRVNPEDLENRSPHEFVKVAFKLDWMLAATAVEEWKPLLSKNGKLTQLASVNRIEAMDAVINLREVYKMLTENQPNDGKSHIVREFELEHRDVMEVVRKLEVFLGLPSTATPGGGTVNVSSGQMNQMIKVLQQINNNTKKSAAAMKKAGGVQVRVLPNERDNTILVQAPPDKMQTISEIIEALDRPKRKSRAIPEIMDRMRIYRLTETDPTTLVNTLKELGDLDYDTRLQVDQKNKAVIAFASLADHFTITKLVEKLDGNGREFHVIRLRRLEADYVTGTINFMMGIEDKDKQNQNSYYRYSRYGSQPEQSNDKFRVDADVDNNQLILRCNDTELAEVENLLVKLGEMPARGGNPDTVRVIDEYSEEEVEAILERIRKAWPQYSPNELKIAPGSKPKPDKSEEKTDQNQDSKKPSLDKVVPSSKKRDTRTKAAPQIPNDSANVLNKTAFAKGDSGLKRLSDDGGIPTPEPAARKFLKLLQLQQQNAIGGDDDILAQSAADEPNNTKETQKDDKAAPPKNDKPAESKDAGPTLPKDPFERRGPSTQTQQLPLPPVSISRGPDGKLIIRSDDPRVLDLLEDLMTEYAPPRTGFRIFKLKNPNTWAYGIELNLEEFFEEEQKSQKGSGGSGYSYDPFFGMMRSSSGSSSGGGSRRLSKRKPLKFISDRDTHSILVQGATPDQMQTIEDLINLWDKPESEEQRVVRKTKVFSIKYSRAKVIADAIKDVYRDLLSSNDRALENKNQEDKSKSGSGAFGQSYTYVYGGNSDDDAKSSKEPPIKFKGLLSIGIDELSNNLIISASEGLLENIGVLVETLDEAAKPTSSVQVFKVHSRLNSALLRQRLHKVFGAKPPPAQPQPNQQNNQNIQGQNRNPRNGNLNFNGRRN